jgi:hypothetical protein
MVDSPRTVLALCLIGLASASATQAGAQAPHALVLETTYQFGTIKQGDRFLHTFVVRNSGAAPLVIERAELSAKGMTARFKPTVGAGEDGEISIEWDTASVAGDVRELVVVYCNDPAQPRLQFALVGTVKPPLEILPFPAVFASMFKGENTERTLRLINNEDRPLRIKGVVPAGHFTATLKTIQEGKAYELVVKFSDDLPLGHHTEALYVETVEPTVSRIVVPVNLFVKNDLYVNPEGIDFGDVSLDYLARYPEGIDFLTQTIMVTKRDGQFEIASLDSDLPCLALMRSPMSGISTGFRIDVGLRRATLRPGRIEGSIRILTDDKRFPELTIPVRGEVH